MTLGVGWEEQSDLAALIGASEDRRVAGYASRSIEADPSLMVTTGFDPSDGANYSGGSSFSPDLPLTPSSAGLAGMLGANTGVTQPDVLKQIRKTKSYLKKQFGKPYPNVLNQQAIARGYVTPTAQSGKDSIYKGWNAAAQPGPAPGLVEGTMVVRDLDVGGLTYAQAMNYAPSPLTEQLGALRSFGELEQEASAPQQQPVSQMKNNMGGILFLALAGLAAYGLYDLWRDMTVDER